MFKPTRCSSYSEDCGMSDCSSNVSSDLESASQNEKEMTLRKTGRGKGKVILGNSTRCKIATGHAYILTFQRTWITSKFPNGKLLRASLFSKILGKFWYFLFNKGRDVGISWIDI